MNAQLNVTPLAAKAMLVKLTTRKVTLTSRDKNAEEYLQGELGDSAYVVNKKLFRDPANPINKIISTASEVYTYHRGHTLAYVDKGPRLLPNTQYIDYTAGMRERIGKDLHDGIIQAIYGIGLSLEDVPELVEDEEGRTEAVARVDPQAERPGVDGGAPDDPQQPSPTPRIRGPGVLPRMDLDHLRARLDEHLVREARANAGPRLHQNLVSAGHQSANASGDHAHPVLPGLHLGRNAYDHGSLRRKGWL